MPTVGYNGKTINFPDGTSSDDMAAAMQQIDAPEKAPPISTTQPLTLRVSYNGAPAVTERQDMPGEQIPGLTPQAARTGLSLSGRTGLPPQLVAQNPKEVEELDAQQRLTYLSGLPRLSEYAGKGPVHLAAISDDIDKLGVLEYVFGKSEVERYFTDPSGAQALGKVPAPYPDNMPGWILEAGRYTYDQITSLKELFQLKFGDGVLANLVGGPVDAEAVKRERAVAQNTNTGQYSGAARLLAGGQQIIQNVAPFMVHPALSFGLMYADGTAHTYEGLRQHGYGHEEARDVGEAVGFASATVGTLLGSRLFGEPFPKAALSFVGDAVPSATLRAVSDNPALWKFIRDTGINQLHAAAMNVGVAATEAGMVQLYDSFTRGNKFNYSLFADTLWRATKGSLQLLPLSAMAATRGAAQRARLWEEGGPLRGFQQMQAEQMDVEQRIYDEYERQGKALKSLKQAGDIAAAADTVQRSKFMQENPEQGRDLLRSLLKPRKSQTIFVNPEHLLKLPEAELNDLQVKNMAEAMTSHSFAEVPAENFFTSPSAPQMAKDAKDGPEDWTSKEAEKNIDPPPPLELTKLMAQRDFVETNEEDSPEKREKLNKINEEMRGLAVAAPLSDSAWERLGLGGKPQEAQEPAPQRRPEPAKNTSGQPMLGFRGKPTRERLRAWADEEAEGRPIGSLDSLARQHGQQADVADKRARELQEQATGGLGRSTRKAQKGVSAGVESGQSGQSGAEAALSGDATDKAVRNWIDRSKSWEKKAEDKGAAAVKEEVKAGDKLKQVERLEKISKVNDAMASAVKRAGEEADGIKDAVKEHSSDEQRRKLYAGGEATWEYATTHDAILEALGGKQTGWGAPDASNAVDAMARDGFTHTADSIDVKLLNKLIQNPRPLDDMTLPEARAVREALDNLSAVAHAQATVRANDQRQAVEDVAGQIAEHLKPLPFAPPGQRAWFDNSSALSFVQKIGGFKSKLQAELNQPHTIWFKMGPMGDHWWFEKFVPARSREEQWHAEIMPRLEAVEREFPQDIRETGKDIVQALPGAPAQMGLRTRSDVWRLLLHMGTQSGIDKIAKGMRVSPESLVSWAQSQMAATPEHVPAIMEKLIEPTWKVFGKLWEKYEPALRERGFPPPKVLDALPFTVGGKTYSGGYGGRLRWLDANLRTSVDPESMAALLGFDNQGPSTQQGHLRDRTGAAGIPDLAWGGVSASMRAEIHDLAFHGFAEDSLKLLKQLREDPMVVDKLGKHFMDQLWAPDNETSWLHVVARGKIPDMSALSATGIISNLQGRAALSAFALNARVLAMQASHIPAMAAGMNLPMTFGGAFVAERRAWAEANSEVLRYRQNDFERKNTDLLADLTGVRPGEGLETQVPGAGPAIAALQRGSNQLNWEIWKQLDGFLSHALWEMGLHKGIAERLSMPEAMRAGDKAVQRGMPVQTIYEQSAFVRDRAAFGLLFLVRNFPNTLYNVQALESWEARRSGASGLSAAPRALASGATYIGMVLAAEILGKNVAGGNLPTDRDDPDAWLAANIGRALTYPIYADAPTEAGIKTMMGDRSGAMQSMDRMTPASLKVATHALTGLGDAVWSDDEHKIRGAMEVLGFGTKLPIPRLADWVMSLDADTPGEFVARGAGYTRGGQ